MTPTMEKQMQEKVENKMETGVIKKSRYPGFHRGKKE